MSVTMSDIAASSTTTPANADNYAHRTASQTLSTSTTATATSPLTEAELTAASELTVFDSNGNKVRFGELFEFQKTIVVFIRESGYSLVCLVS